MHKVFMIFFVVRDGIVSKYIASIAEIFVYLFIIKCDLFKKVNSCKKHLFDKFYVYFTINVIKPV